MSDPSERSRRSWLTLLLAVSVVVVPVAGYCVVVFAPAPEPPPARHPVATFPRSKLPFRAEVFGPAADGPEQITNVQILDFDKDGKNDVIACDARFGNVLLYRRDARGRWREERLNPEPLAAPAHATVVDLDRDGDSDVLVSLLGRTLPTDERVGRGVWLENRGKPPFVAHIILDDVRRIADMQPGDFDGDGDIDIAVAEFGYLHGGIWWLENDGKNRFIEHELSNSAGTIHVPVADFDGDGDLDFVAVVSQDEEEIWAFVNEGKRPALFRRKKLYMTHNFDLGTSGLVPCDLDQDGDQDFLLTAGDNLELLRNHPQPWHGCFWFENRGKWKFVPHRIATFGGVYASAPGDLDGDGDLDVVLVSLFNDWNQPDAASIVWLENDGKQNFRTWQIDSSPIHLATVTCGDIDGDGALDILAGCFDLVPPFTRLGRIHRWSVTRKAND